jgi:aminotransferase
MNVFQTIPYHYLRQHAFNMRWAEVPEGVIPLTAADSDIPFSSDISSAIIEASQQQLFPYSAPQGSVSFRSAMSHHFKKVKNCIIHPDEVLATNSAAGAIQDWCNHFLSKGDEVLIPDPVDFLLGYCAEKAGATVIRVPAQKHWNSELWESYVTPKTKAIILCHPHNPLGFYYNEKDLNNIREFIEKNQLLVLSDEVWSDIVLEGKFTSMRQLVPSAWVVYGMSKGFGLAGLRLGALIAPDASALQALMESQGYYRTVQGASSLSQVAGTAAMDSKNARTDFLKIVQRTMRVAVDRLNKEQTFFKVNQPDATFVLWLSHPDHLDSQLLAERMEKEAKVKLVPGLEQWFGPGAKGHIRMSCATTPEVMNEAITRIIDWVNHNV